MLWSWVKPVHWLILVVRLTDLGRRTAAEFHQVDWWVCLWGHCWLMWEGTDHSGLCHPWGGGLGLYKTAGWPPAREMSGELPSSMVSVSFPASSFPWQWIVTWQCKPTLSFLLLVVVLICATERQASTASSLASCFSVYCISHPESFASLGKL